MDFEMLYLMLKRAVECCETYHLFELAIAKHKKSMNNGDTHKHPHKHFVAHKTRGMCSYRQCGNFTVALMGYMKTNHTKKDNITIKITIKKLHMEWNTSTVGHYCNLTAV